MHNIKYTKDVSDAFSNESDLHLFLEKFKNWECTKDSYFFGKDGAYRNPLVMGKYELRHVHLTPIIDLKAKDKWDFNYENYKNCTSNRALIYATSNCSIKKHILISILDEPNAHAVAEMKTKEHKDFMQKCARVAEDFIYFGNVYSYIEDVKL